MFDHDQIVYNPLLLFYLGMILLKIDNSYHWYGIDVYIVN